jgi:predicted AlkP superfamily pyrophosphatase or phosphodiesterase
MRGKKALLGLAAVAATICWLVGATSVKAVIRPTSLLLISIDGLRPDYVLQADDLGLRIPNLRRLVRDGAYAVGVAGVVPTVTFPSHTTQVTGVSPARHGIVANTPFDPTGRNLDGWFWYAEDIKVPTLWDAAARAGLLTSSVEWPATAGARIDFNIPQYWRARTTDDRKVHRLLASPGLLDEAEAALGTYPASHDWTIEGDVRRAAFSAWLIERKRPRLHLAYFSALDEQEHRTEPFSKESLAVLERIDGLVGTLRDAAAKNGPAVVAVVSDHGFSRSDKEVHLNEALRALGLIQLDARGRVNAWRACAWSAGGSAAVMLKDPADDDARRRVKALLERLQRDAGSGVRSVLEGHSLRDAGGFPDAAFVVGLRRGYRMGGDLHGPVVRAGEVQGTHGLLPDDSSMDAAFFLGGPGIPSGRSLGRIDMRDVAPTLAARLGLSLPQAEGRDVLD